MQDIKYRALTTAIAMIAVAFLDGLTAAAHTTNRGSSDTTHNTATAQEETGSNREWLNGIWAAAYCGNSAPKDMLVFDKRKNVTS